MISSQSQNTRQRLVRRSRAYLAAVLLGGVGAGAGLTVAAAHGSTGTTAQPSTTPATTSTSTPSASPTTATKTAKAAKKAQAATTPTTAVKQATTQTVSGSSHAS